MKLLTNPKGFGIVRLLVVGLVLLSTVRCGDAPTQPLTPMAPSAEALAPVAVPINLGGPWHGTFTFLDCSDPVELTLTQSGNAISGHVSTSCAPGPGGHLSGTLDGNSLTIQLIFEGSRYHLRGAASSFRIDVNYGGNEDAMSLHLVRSLTPRR